MQIDTLPLYWAIHRLSGIASPANASYSVSELAHQLQSSKSKALFTCTSLLAKAREAAAKSGIPENRIYLLDSAICDDSNGPDRSKFKTVNALVETGSKLAPLEPLRWQKGQGKRQCAFLCYSSGTSGWPVRAFAL
jgi:long-subunit acyl-CoA synthetase (AMP-forming)